ncbi:PD-(D/E)XK nuclease family protein [Roseitranquillus sediminis]|uniref:PD-(D/E)XK nuclease family protein n=1 Tax=Roseitranquillus sediminis TaxID=2809051 RepID=UPI001D0C2EBC|nr:PD-(D/E)XK nuclease family protein [Roseitranquillus sediminis]MBM9596253.1 PD-(D/E)XK nuclease family protein [Roseitranquillus sediminis]
MFEPSDLPRVIGVPPGADFAAVVARGLDRTFGTTPEALARTTLYANSGRMRRRLQEALEAAGPRLMPRLRLIDGIGLEAGVASPPLRRRLELARLIAALLDRQPELAPRSAAFDLADSLAQLMDEITTEGVLPEALETLELGDHAAHWSRSARFLRIALDYVADAAEPDAARLRRHGIERLIAAWQAAPPAAPVLAVGSTGSRGASAELLAAIARLPQGAIVLPGFDFDMPKGVWERLKETATAEDHPQFRIAALLERLHLAPSQVQRWGDAPVPSRNRLISLALRPAPVTDQWRSEGSALHDIAEATQAVTLIEAPSPRLLALSLALRLRRAVEDGATAALITPDRTLSRRVAAALDRWGIEPDDSAGRPLAQSAPGRLLRHVAAFMGRRLTVEALLVLLKHPLVASGGDRGAHLLATRELELHLRRHGPAFPTAADLAGWRDDDWTRWIAKTVFAPHAGGTALLSRHVERHLAMAEALAAGPNDAGSGGLWDEEPGRKAAEAMAELASEATHGGEMDAADYEQLIAMHLTGEVREATGPHPDVMFWGTLEARSGGAGLTILAGLDEGVWPAIPAPDPWLNRAMRAATGLTSPERQIGLAAHDFQQAAAAPEVVLARTLRDTEAETVPSRWLNRLTNLLDGLPGQGGPEALAAMRARGDAWVAAAEAHGRMPKVPRVARPSPRPPVAARPRRLSVTQISRLIRDPYEIYARHVLRLRPLDPLRHEADAPLRGSVLHLVFDRFVREGPDADVAAAVARLGRIADEVLAAEVPWPLARRLWRARLDRVAPWFAATERDRRARGTPLITEERGEWSMTAPDFTLTGVADRIDRLSDGTLAIYDYKTGAPPTPKQVRKYDKQLLLEAVMAEAGAFPGVPAARVAEVGYIAVGGSGSYKPIPLEPGESAGIAAEFRRLIGSWDEPGRGYTSRRAVERRDYAGDYDHLARFGEWEDSDAPETPR